MHAPESLEIQEHFLLPRDVSVPRGLHSSPGNATLPSLRGCATALKRVLLVAAAFTLVLVSWRYWPVQVEIPMDGPVADWPDYGNDKGGTRYSPLTQITKENVRHPKVAWVYHTGDWSDGVGEEIPKAVWNSGATTRSWISLNTIPTSLPAAASPIGKRWMPPGLRSSGSSPARMAEGSSRSMLIPACPVRISAPRTRWTCGAEPTGNAHDLPPAGGRQTVRRYRHGRPR